MCLIIAHACLIISTDYVYNRSNTTVGTTVYVELDEPDNPKNSGPTSITIISKRHLDRLMITLYML
jgi:hypothetical protein